VLIAGGFVEGRPRWGAMGWRVMMRREMDAGRTGTREFFWGFRCVVFQQVGFSRPFHLVAVFKAGGTRGLGLCTPHAAIKSASPMPTWMVGLRPWFEEYGSRGRRSAAETAVV